MTIPSALGYSEDLALAAGANQPPAVDQGQAHREKVKKLKGPNYPTQDEAEGLKISYVNACWQEGETDALARYRSSAKNICYANGRQHVTWNASRKTIEDLPLLDEHDIRATINEIRPILRARAQRMMGAPRAFSITPDSNAYDARDRAQVGVNLLHARYRATEMRAKEDQAQELAFSCGVAAFKSFWNPDIGPLTPAKMQGIQQQPMVMDDGTPMTDEMGQPMMEIVYDEQGAPAIEEFFVDGDGQRVETEDEAFQYRPGDSDTAVRSIFNLRCNPEATGWDAGSGLRWVIDSETVPLSVAREKFVEFADRIMASKATDSGLTFEKIAASSTVPRPVSGVTDAAPVGSQNNRSKTETTVLREYWELPSDCYRGGRVITIAGDVVVYDGPFPQGIFPYAPIYDEPAPLTWAGKACVSDMISPQDVINEQWTAIVKEMRSTAVGQWIGWNVPGMDDQVTREPYTVMKVPMHPRLANRSIRDVIQRVEQASVSADRWRLIDSAKQALYNIGAYHEVTRGQVPPGVDSGVAIEHLLEQESGQLMKSVHARRDSWRKWAADQLAICRWGYGDNTERYIPVDRPDLGYQVESVTGVQLPDPASVSIDLEGFKAYSEAAFRAEIKELMTAKVLTPQEGLKALDMGRGVSSILESQNRHYGKARAENLAIERGQVQVVPSEEMISPDGMPLDALVSVGDKHNPDGAPLMLPLDDDHAIHLDVLKEIILDTTKPWEVRQMAMVHAREHEFAMQMVGQKQAQEQAQLQMIANPQPAMPTAA